jgi:hypothetical protein
MDSTNRSKAVFSVAFLATDRSRDKKHRYPCLFNTAEIPVNIIGSGSTTRIIGGLVAWFSMVFPYNPTIPTSGQRLPNSKP